MIHCVIFVNKITVLVLLTSDDDDDDEGDLQNPLQYSVPIQGHVWTKKSNNMCMTFTDGVNGYLQEGSYHRFMDLYDMGSMIFFFIKTESIPVLCLGLR